MKPINEDPIQSGAESLTATQIDTRHAHKLLERALNQFGRGEHEAALLGCRQAVGLAPNSFPAHSLLSMLSRLDNDLDSAISHSEKALAILPGHELERERLAGLRLARTNNVASFALRLGEWEQFRQEIRREIELNDLFASQKLSGATSSAPQSSTVFEKPLSFSPANPEVPQSQNAVTTARSNPHHRNLAISISLAITVIGLAIYFSTRSAQVIQPPRPQNTTATNAAKANKPAYSQVDGEQPAANPTSLMNPAVQAPQTPASIPGTLSVPNQPHSAQAGGNPSTNSPQTPSRSEVVARGAVQQQPSQVQTSERTSLRSAVERPAAPPPPPVSGNRRSITSVPQYSPSTPTASPIESSPAKASDDVGPRFSPPDQGDDVGPRFSAP